MTSGRDGFPRLGRAYKAEALGCSGAKRKGKEGHRPRAMGEEECLPLIAAGGRPPPSNALEILWGASKLLGRAWKLMLPVLFIYLIPSSFLFLAAYVGTMPWIVDMVRALFAMKTKGSSNLECLALLPQLIEDLREFAAVGVGMMLASFLLSSFITTAVINTLAKASKVEKVTSKQLFYKITREWECLSAVLLYANLLVCLHDLSAATSGCRHLELRPFSAVVCPVRRSHNHLEPCSPLLADGQGSRGGGLGDGGRTLRADEAAYHRGRQPLTLGTCGRVLCSRRHGVLLRVQKRNGEGSRLCQLVSLLYPRFSLL